MIAAIILTKNEGKHLERCLRSIESVVDIIYVIDCGSTDNTKVLAESFGATVIVNPWINYSTQFNYGLGKVPVDCEWVLRIDADEYVDNDLISYVREELPYIGDEISGISFSRLMTFMGRPIRHGGMYPIWQLRLFRRAVGCCESRWMDEHIVLSSGKSVRGRGVITDDNINTVTWWTEKHNSYASREAIDILCYQYTDLVETKASTERLDKQASFKRSLKQLYAYLPLGLRPILYFLYRYLLLFGFLDGKRGLMFHCLQGFWYRFLVDVKVYEVKKYALDHHVDIKKSISRVLNINL